MQGHVHTHTPTTHTHSTHTHTHPPTHPPRQRGRRSEWGSRPGSQPSRRSEQGVGVVEAGEGWKHLLENCILSRSLPCSSLPSEDRLPQRGKVRTPGASP